MPALTAVRHLSGLLVLANKLAQENTLSYMRLVKAMRCLIAKHLACPTRSPGKMTTK